MKSVKYKFKILKKKFSKLKGRIIKFLKKSKKKIISSFKKHYREYLNLILEITIYGAILNYIFFAFEVLPFSIRLLYGFGFIFYFIKDELTEIIRSCKR
jgi:hypothetical protein